MTKIRNIVFDLGGVLVGLDSHRSVSAFNGLGCSAVSRYIEEHRTEDLFHDIELGLMTTDEFCEEVRRISDSSASDEEIVAAWNALLSPVSNECLQRLRSLREAGCRLFLLSNTNDMHWKFCSDALSGCFERVFLSYEMGLAKPDPKIFTEVLRLAELEAGDTLFIDDNAANIASAASVGMRTFHNENMGDWLKNFEWI